jgi:hypothetical protein
VLDRKYTNYLTHEVKVKVSEGIVTKDNNWQWFIDYIEENYNLEDIRNFDEFEQRKSSIFDILFYFYKILNVCKIECHFKSQLLSEIFRITRYHFGEIGKNECINNVNTEFGKLVFVLVWITKLENSDNKTSYLVDFRIFEQNNLHQGIKIASLEENKEDILDYIEKVKIEGFEIVLKTIKSNLNKVNISVSENFFEAYKDCLVSVNCFNYQLLNREKVLTWQENILLDMVMISIENGEIIPLVSNEKGQEPNCSDWTSEVIKNLRKFFNNEISDFILESIEFLLYTKIPSKMVIEKHLELVMNELDNCDIDTLKKYSSFQIVALLDKNTEVPREVFSNFYRRIHAIKEVSSLSVIQDYFSVAKEQKEILKQFIENQYKAISEIEDIYSFINYLGNTEVAKYIDSNYYDNVIEKMSMFIASNDPLIVAKLFYYQMLFLMNVKETNIIVDKRVVQREIVSLQKYWQTNIYSKIEKIPLRDASDDTLSVDVDTINNIIMNNPFLIAKDCVIAGLEERINCIKEISFSLLSLVDRININPIFPIGKTGIDIKNNSIDEILKEEVEKIIKQYKDRFYNVFSSEVYTAEMHECYKRNVLVIATIFNLDKELYNKLEKSLNVTLIPYENDVLLGHVTQLFPLLEDKIRSLGRFFGIVPFKENKREFIKYKDPSSILREIIKMVYEKFENLESVSDLLFVYHFMYNSNSLNIRNECIHGRDYSEGERLKLGFKITILSLYMIMYRIELIEKNVVEKQQNC